jgi:hypothetical protein
MRQGGLARMLFLTRWFGVTGSDAERGTDREQSDIKEITERVLLMQANAAARQRQPLRRGTHAKGVCVRAQFEVFDLTLKNESSLAKRLAMGIFATPGVYPAVVRFGNADPKANSDLKPDVRSLSFSVDLSQEGATAPGLEDVRQDFSLQNATTLPINDSPAFLALMKVLTASNPIAGLWGLSLKDKLKVLRTIVLAQMQARQPIKPYQQLRYWSNVPFRHGQIDVVKQSAIPFPENAAHPLQLKNPNALQDELIRHLGEDNRISGFDFGLQFLDPDKMTYWGERRDANFWIENASVEWKETEAPFHTVGRLTLLPNSQLSPNDGEKIYFDVTGHSTPESKPLGSINRARGPAEQASRKSRDRRGQPL